MRRIHPLLALAYDPIMWTAERRTFGRLRGELLGKLHGDVLEVGAGTGLSFIHYPAGANVLALEPDPLMFRRAEKRIRASGPSIVLELGGDEWMSKMPARSFDAIVFAFVLCTVEEPQKTLAQAARLLRLGGRLALLEHVRSHGKLGTWQDRLRPFWERIGGGCQLNRETRALVAEAGFDVSALRNERIAGGIVQDLLVGTAYAGS